MDKKRIVYNFALVLPASMLVLYFGLVFASRSLVSSDTILSDDQEIPCYIDDEMPDQFVATCMFLAEQEEGPFISKDLLTALIKNQLRTAGRTEGRHGFIVAALEAYAEQEQKKTVRRPRRSPLRRTRRNRTRSSSQKGHIRPERAHKMWKRLQRKNVFRWPVDPAKFWISSYYGPRTLRGRKGFHQGIDMAAPTGTPIVAAAHGIVLEAKYVPGYGNYILIAHAERYKTRYAHLHRILVKVGQEVHKGQLIGKVGATGKVMKNKTSKSASHLHFEVYCDGERDNPFRYLA